MTHSKLAQARAKAVAFSVALASALAFAGCGSAYHQDIFDIANQKAALPATPPADSPPPADPPAAVTYSLTISDYDDAGLDFSGSSVVAKVSHLTAGSVVTLKAALKSATADFYNLGSPIWATASGDSVVDPASTATTLTLNQDTVLSVGYALKSSTTVVLSFKVLRAGDGTLQQNVYPYTLPSVAPPIGYFSVVMKAWGAGGGAGNTTAYTGGAGAYSTATVGFSANTLLTIVVGQGGANCAGTPQPVADVPGAGGATNAGGGNGGGASLVTVYSSGTSLYTVDLCAGGGGGGGGWGSGGAAGVASGTTGGANNGGSGGAGGTNASSNMSPTGATMAALGGKGGNAGGNFAGAGGGGYGGGASGDPTYQTAGGGGASKGASSYAGTGRTPNILATGDPYWVAAGGVAGYGGLPATGIASDPHQYSGYDGNDGLVVLTITW